MTVTNFSGVPPGGPWEFSQGTWHYVAPQVRAASQGDLLLLLVGFVVFVAVVFALAWVWGRRPH